jgi:hypothetical protein
LVAQVLQRVRQNILQNAIQYPGMHMNHFIKKIAIVLALIVPLSAHAAYILTLDQVGNNVIATGGGSIDLADLAFFSSGFDVALLDPDLTIIIAGSAASTPDSYYSGIAGPAGFGSGSGSDATSGAGGVVGIVAASGKIIVPDSYASGASLGTSTSTFDNTTLAALGVTPGTYEWTWGTGPDADSFTLDAGTASNPEPVPEPATLSLLAAGLAGIGLVRRLRNTNASD